MAVDLRKKWLKLWATVKGMDEVAPWGFGLVADPLAELLGIERAALAGMTNAEISAALDRVEKKRSSDAVARLRAAVTRHREAAARGIEQWKAANRIDVSQRDVDLLAKVGGVLGGVGESIFSGLLAGLKPLLVPLGIAVGVLFAFKSKGGGK